MLNLFQHLFSCRFRIRQLTDGMTRKDVKLNLMLFFIILNSLGEVFAQTKNSTTPDFKWGNAAYFNLNVGESIFFNNAQIKLLKLENHFNQIQVNRDTIWIKVSKRSLPASINGLRIFVADNKNVKELTTDRSVHGLLTKDALICISDNMELMLNSNQYIFPISFNDGFLWSTEEDSHMFSYLGLAERKPESFFRSHEGIDFDLHDARGKEKHWIIALENSTVVWVEDKGVDEAGKEACVLLKSESQPGIYYVYQHLYNKNIEVKKGQKLIKGEPIGTIWGDEIWGNLQFAVVKSDSIPTYQNRFDNLINFFPQMYELYFNQSYNYSKSFTKGRICFGKLRSLNGNEKNAHAFEEYSGKGWKLGKWNTFDKVDWVLKGEEGNARLNKKMFSDSKFARVNPDNWYNYEINVPNGVYRIRAKVGDLFLPTWQRILFEGVNAATYSLKPGELKWTSERAVKVTDRKLTIRIYVDDTNNKTAGLSEIVFQRAY